MLIAFPAPSLIVDLSLDLLSSSLLSQKDRVVVEAAEHYLSLAHRLQREELPYGTAWRDVESYREKLVATKEYEWINFREQKVSCLRVLSTSL